MTSLGNHLVQSLPRKDRTRFLSECRSVELAFAEILCEPGEPMDHVYFPVNCVISCVACKEGEPNLEVGMVGSEGMLGDHLALGVSSAPFHALVQAPGLVWRMRRDQFLQQLRESAALQRVLQRYLYVRFVQLGNQAVCAHFHQVNPRLARWLLMSQDRSHADSFHMTHEFMAYLLGVRRVGITKAAGSLQRDGLIKYHHGFLSVLDRPGLEAAACNCYAKDVAVYDKLLP
ncbi:Crp/Fnr family transcriptional regulator [Hylemonella gracilis]|uniref:Crp/Fnr family transcriptional regulator n=1 Tax=Hylemonella gracilis TaxID=80880 RepID=A0A4P6UKE8_9BURK|nr:Crp/Fnr family transcriptional regulator [Hylemonella gracilis]QBK04587.1 Crp/Fnr family transcriptional regulator [Hylemonella gracilis]